MPTLIQGDIFEAASRVNLAIVFGHIGVNEMRQRWAVFATDQPRLKLIDDPFNELSGQAVEWQPGKYLWFVADSENQGMAEQALLSTMDGALSWAFDNRLHAVATNGIANVDHGQSTAENRRSDEQRARFLRDYAARAEEQYGVTIDLVSLNDVFTRIAG